MIRSRILSKDIFLTSKDSIDNLRNLGPTSAQWLRAAGICSIGDLRRIGPVAAYRLVKQSQPRASLNLLWGLAAGIQNRDWRELTDAEKRQLMREVEEL